MNFLKKSGNKFQRHSTIPIVIGETGALQDKIEKSERIKWSSSPAERTCSYGSPLSYWSIYTDAERFGPRARQHLSIRDALKLNSTTPLTILRKMTLLYPS